MRIILVRHGQTPSNVAGALDTARPGAGLSGLGTRQAAALVDAFAGERVDAVHCSPLVRTRLTAQPLADDRGHRVEVVEGLEEISAGAYEMSTAPEHAEAYVAVVQAWFDGDLDAHLPDGPDGHHFLQRYDAALRQVATNLRTNLQTNPATSPVPGGGGADGTAVLVSHGAAIRAFLVLRLGAPDRRLANTAAATIDGDPDSGWRLVAWTGDPLGGVHLRDDGAHDITGEPAED